MPLGTLERSAPPFFKQGPSALSRLALYSALALFLMVADARFHLTDPLRKAVGAVLYPAQWLMLQPVEMVRGGAGYFESLQSAQQEADAARQRMTQMSQRANQAELLAQENQHLRALLGLRERLATPAMAAQVVYDTPDPYTRRVIVDKGQMAGVELGSPVVDEFGVLGQVTRVHPFVSEVTLLVDRDQAIPVLNPRTGVRSVAYGDPVEGHGGSMELRFMPSNADVQEGDLLTTSGVDGVYPPGLPVAHVRRVDRKADSAFTRIYCDPVAQVNGVRHVMVLKPLHEDLPERPEPEPAAKPARKGASLPGVSPKSAKAAKEPAKEGAKP
jgi:rod shape-determining protein MreC